jgi:hypothetical protein
VNYVSSMCDSYKLAGNCVYMKRGSICILFVFCARVIVNRDIRRWRCAGCEVLGWCFLSFFLLFFLGFFFGFRERGRRKKEEGRRKKGVMMGCRVGRRR